MDDLGDQGDGRAADRRGRCRTGGADEQSRRALLATLTEAFDAIDDDRPTVFLAYTIKGWQTPLAGHKDNHGGLMTPAQMAEFQARLGVPEGEEWAPMAGVADPDGLRRLPRQRPFFAAGPRRRRAAPLPVPVCPLDDRVQSTQAGFGKILDGWPRAAGRWPTGCDHVARCDEFDQSDGPWVNRRGLFARREVSDTFRDQNVPSTQKWGFSPRVSTSSLASPR